MLDLDRLSRLLAEYIDELENAATSGDYHLLNVINDLTDALEELEKLELTQDFAVDE